MEKQSNTIRLYGKHAIYAALSNPSRRCLRLLYCNDEDKQDLLHRGLLRDVKFKKIDVRDCREFFPGRRTQGLLLDCLPLTPRTLEGLTKHSVKQKAPSILLALDHVQDERNVGAIMRTAYLMGVKGIIMTKDHGPSESPDMAHAACGAFDRVPLARVTNLVRAISALHKEHEYWPVALESNPRNADAIKGTALPRDEIMPKVCIVAGSEGKGLRLLTRRACPFYLHLQTPGLNPKDPYAPESYNVASAISLGLAQVRRLAS